MKPTDQDLIAEALTAARAFVAAVERLAVGSPDAAKAITALAATGRRPDVVSPPCVRHGDQPASRCGRCAAEAVPAPVDLLGALQRSVDTARTAARNARKDQP